MTNWDSGQFASVQTRCETTGESSQTIWYKPRTDDTAFPNSVLSRGVLLSGACGSRKKIWTVRPARGYRVAALVSVPPTINGEVAGCDCGAFGGTGVGRAFTTIFSFSRWLTHAIAGLKEGRNAERNAILPCPRIQIVEGVPTKSPSNLSTQKA